MSFTMIVLCVDLAADAQLNRAREVKAGSGTIAEQSVFRWLLVMTHPSKAWTNFP